MEKYPPINLTEKEEEKLKKNFLKIYKNDLNSLDLPYLLERHINHMEDQEYKLDQDIDSLRAKALFMEDFLEISKLKRAKLFELQKTLKFYYKISENPFQFIENQNPEIVTLEPKTIKLNFNSNHFNEACFSLFNHLLENYTKKGKRKYINIYYFLRDKCKDKEMYFFSMKIEEYKSFIKSEYGVEFPKFSKAQYLYEDQEVPKLKQHEMLFRTNYLKKTKEV